MNASLIIKKKKKTIPKHHGALLYNNNVTCGVRWGGWWVECSIKAKHRTALVERAQRDDDVMLLNNKKKYIYSSRGHYFLLLLLLHKLFLCVRYGHTHEEYLLTGRNLIWRHIWVRLIHFVVFARVSRRWRIISRFIMWWQYRCVGAGVDGPHSSRPNCGCRHYIYVYIGSMPHTYTHTWYIWSFFYA